MLVIIGRAEAKAKGLARYFTGKPCKHGHISERYVRGTCIKCAVLVQMNLQRGEQWRKANLEKRRTKARELYYNKKATRVLVSIDEGLKSATARGIIMDESEAAEIFKAQHNAFEYSE